MATKKYFLCLLIALLILAGIAPSLQAQNTGYYIKTESGEIHFIQRLAWTGGEYAFRYEVVIERETGGTRTTHLREFTTTPFIEVSLPPGNYRFQVISHDILDRPEETSLWKYFEVLPAIQPKISEVLIAASGGSDDVPSGYVLNILGEDISPDAEYIIRYYDGTQIIPQVLDSGEDGKASLFVDSGELGPGQYELITKNPGGLETKMGGIVFSGDLAERGPDGGIPIQQRPMLFFANAAYAPVFPIHGDFFGTNVSLAGAGAHAGVAFLNPIGLHIGGELAFFWNLSNNTANDDLYSVLSLGANLLLLKWLPTQEPMALSFRLGLSFALLPEIQDKVMLNIGASYLWRFTDLLTLEAGLDYAVLIREISFDGSLRPWIGVGVIF